MSFWPEAGISLDVVTFGGPLEFPGTLDEIRVSGIARTAAEIESTWTGQ